MDPDQVAQALRGCGQDVSKSHRQITVTPDLTYRVNIGGHVTPVSADEARDLLACLQGALQSGTYEEHRCATCEDEGTDCILWRSRRPGGCSTWLPKTKPSLRLCGTCGRGDNPCEKYKGAPNGCTNWMDKPIIGADKHLITLRKPGCPTVEIEVTEAEFCGALMALEGAIGRSVGAGEAERSCETCKRDGGRLTCAACEDGSAWEAAL